MASKNWNCDAGTIRALLKKKYADGRQWICASEVGNVTGFAIRRLDFVVANCYESKGYGIHAFEIKISKSDLRRELEDSAKHTVFFDELDSYSLIAPDYVLDAEYVALIPPKWGIYAVKFKQETNEKTIVTIRNPLCLHDEQEKNRVMSRGFAMSMLRAMAHQDEKCIPHDLYQEAYNKGRKDERELCASSAGRYEKLYEEDKWKRALAVHLGIWSEEQYLKRTEELSLMSTAVNDMDYLDERITAIVNAAETLRKAFGSLKKKTQTSG